MLQTSSNSKKYDRGIDKAGARVNITQQFRNSAIPKNGLKKAK